MKIHICTLFEHHYHLGVATLVNSLHEYGYSGIVYAGHRGELPPWAKSGSVLRPQPSGISTHLLKVSSSIDIEFIPLSTKNHLTNYKPDFMLSLFEGPARDADSLIYLDPDIVVNEDWTYFEDCAACDILLSEDVNSPISRNHPRRQGWRNAFREHGFDLNCQQVEYANGGLIGCRKERIEFLEIWKSLQEIMFSQIGGGGKAGIAGGEDLHGATGFANCFGKTDQDALNATVEAYHGDVSILGREAMGFSQGHRILPHALGHRKPWTTSYLRDAFLGIPPRLVDKLFWSHASGPVKAFSLSYLKRKRISIRMASFLGRFYRKS